MAGFGGFGAGGGGFGGGGFGGAAAGGFGASAAARPAAGGFGQGAGLMGAPAAQEGGVDVVPPGSLPDSVSALAFCPNEQQNILLVGLWDGSVRTYSIAAQANMNPEVAPTINQAAIQPGPQGKHDSPVLDVAWHSDCQHFFSASCDGTVKMWNLSQPGQGQVVAKHAGPIKCVAALEPGCTLPYQGGAANLIVTAGWDKMLSYWDVRRPVAPGQQPAPVQQVQLPERAYCMDVKGDLLVVGCAAKKIVIYNLSQPTNPFRSLDSPLKFQTRCLSCFPDKTGFCVGSIEGRVAVHHVSLDRKELNFAFKCHRHSGVVYPINGIHFHLKHGTFSTVGADGAFNFWDKDSKQRLKTSHHYPTQKNKPVPQNVMPISAGAFNRAGNLFAYAESYDWHRGVDGRSVFPKQKERLVVYACVAKDVKKRPPKAR